ncbi:hypothetical protein FGO68_gene7342 [Halteria grandinella]|uniref:Cyclin-like domain-containing protein n=1 Tax=Halteria grandinella TaxID=5974 RepID=A0A8J8NF36_HALGN|nr:hypothetical protein FGO68_gene7342 [Halteria grandinella]
MAANEEILMPEPALRADNEEIALIESYAILNLGDEDVVDMNDPNSVNRLEQKILSNMRTQESHYLVDPDYPQTIQNGEIQWHMRILLIDWLMEVCDEFALCRETFQLAVLYTDLYLSRILCDIHQLQLLGASSLLMASKLEEFECLKVAKIVFTTDNGFTKEQVIDMEQKICKVLGFRLNPPTLNQLMNYFMAKWDAFAKENLTNESSLANPNLIPIFKSENAEDYQRYRSVAQAIDLAILDLGHYKFDKRLLIAACLYIQIGLFYRIFTRQAVSMSPEVERLLVQIEQKKQNREFTVLMETFLTNNFEIVSLREILPAIKYISRYFALDPLKQEFPMILRRNQRSSTQEEFYSYQPHVRDGMSFVKYIKRTFNEVGPSYNKL